MSQYPSLPLFTDAFIADTGHLSAQETGAYLMLMMVAWRSTECRLPDDDDKLARWARVDRRTWVRIKPAVMEFWGLSDGFWTQKRLSKEREFVSKRAEVNRKNGERGGRPKSLENNERDNPTGSPRVSETKAPNPNPTPTEERTPVVPTGSAAEEPALIDDEKVVPIKQPGPTAAQIDAAFDRFWETYPKRDGSNPRKLAYERFAKAIRKGAKPESVIAGAAGYAALMTRTNKIRTEYVQQAAVWLNRDGWLDDYEPTAPPNTKWHMV